MNRKLIAFAGVIALLLSACGASDEPQAGATAEGIQVHGHWTIDIYDSNGSLDSHHEFENALLSEGAMLLSSVLAQESTVGHWVITLTSNPTPLDVPCENLGTPQACAITEPGQATEDNHFDNLEKSVAGGVLTLSGSVTAARSGVIDTAITFLGSCSSDVAPDACDAKIRATGEVPQFTLKTPIPGGPYSLEPGQQALVTVDISFS